MNRNQKLYLIFSSLVILYFMVLGVGFLISPGLGMLILAIPFFALLIGALIYSIFSTYYDLS